MKKLSFAVVILFASYGCTSSKNRLDYPIHQYSEFKFYGKIKAINELTYDIVNSKESILPSATNSYEFDSTGKRIEFYRDDNKHSNSIYTSFTEDYYYESDRLVRMNSFMSQDNNDRYKAPQFTYTYKYTDNGKLTERDEFLAYNGRFFSKDSFEYSNGLDCIKYYCLSHFRGYSYKWQFKHDYIGNLIELNIYIPYIPYGSSIQKNDSVVLVHHVTAKYNEDNDIISEEGFDREGEKHNEANYTYEYERKDTYGNWLIKKVNLYGKLIAVVKREIEYYP